MLDPAGHLMVLVQDSAKAEKKRHDKILVILFELSLNSPGRQLKHRFLGFLVLFFKDKQVVEQHKSSVNGNFVIAAGKADVAEADQRVRLLRVTHHVFAL